MPAGASRRGVAVLTASEIEIKLAGQPYIKQILITKFYNFCKLLRLSSLKEENLVL